MTLQPFVRTARTARVSRSRPRSRWAVFQHPRSAASRVVRTASAALTDSAPAITDVPGIRVGHATDAVALTGVSVVLCDRPAVRAASSSAAGPTTWWASTISDPRPPRRHRERRRPGGGSRFGGEAIRGAALAGESGPGYAAGPTVVPHVPGAFLFDLNVGDAPGPSDARDGLERRQSRRRRGRSPRAAWARAPGPASARSTVSPVPMRGGIGSSSLMLDGGVIVGALVAVNALGDVRDPRHGRADRRHSRHPGRPPAGRLRPHARVRRSARPVCRAQPHDDRRGGDQRPPHQVGGGQGGVAGDAGLRAGALPPHTAFDGDTLFALSVGDVAGDVTRLGLAAADAVARAIVRGVRAATSRPDLPAVADITPGA